MAEAVVTVLRGEPEAVALVEAAGGTEDARAERTLVLALLRGALVDLLATGDTGRVTAAVHRQLASAQR